MEDRFTAIRWAIGTAQKKDIVVIAGKGHHDYQEWDLGYGGLLKVTSLCQLQSADERTVRAHSLPVYCSNRVCCMHSWFVQWPFPPLQEPT